MFVWFIRELRKSSCKIANCHFFSNRKVKGTRNLYHNQLEYVTMQEKTITANRSLYELTGR